MKQRIYYLMILLWITIAILPAPVSAHTKILQSIPVANAQLEQSPAEIKIQYNEELDVSLSRITLFDDTGKQIEGKLDTATDRWLIYQIPQLPGGLYTVKWKVLSADSHLVEGSFTFSVDELKPIVTPIASATPNEVGDGMPSSPSSADSSKETPPEQTASDETKPAEPAPDESAPDEPASDVTKPDETISDEILPDEKETNKASATVYQLVRVMDVLAAIAAAGFVIFRYGIWGILRKEAPPLFSMRNERGLYIAVFLIFTLSGVLQASMLAEQLNGTGTESVGRVGWRILTDTLVGTASWLWPAAAAILFITTFASRGVSLPAVLVKLVAIGIIIVLFPLTGHAYVASTGAGYAILSQIFHIGAAAIWVGGLIGILAAIQGRMQSGLNYRELNKLILRFSVIALPAIVVIVASGIFLALQRVGSWNALIDSAYGQLILAKSTIVLLVLILACIHRLVLIPQMNKVIASSPTYMEQKIPGKFILGVRLEIILAIIAFVLAGMLSTTAPPDKALVAAPLYWHEMGDTAHMSIKVNFKEDTGQTLKLDVWLPTDTGVPTGLAVQLVHSGEDNLPVSIPFEFITGGPDPYGFEGFDKYMYEAQGIYFSEKGDWQAIITFTDSTGETHRYEKLITL